LDTPTTIVIGATSLMFGLAAATAAGLLGTAWDRFAQRQVDQLGQRFQELGMGAERLQTMLRLWGACLLSIAVGGVVLRSWPLALVLLWLTYVAPHHFLSAAIRRREKLLRDQMVVASLGLANAAKAGLSLAQGFETVCSETPLPLKNELRRIVFDYHCGRPLRDAIEEVRRRLDLDCFSLFAIAVQVALHRGGRVNAALERISESLYETQRLERKLDADTSSGRQMVLILSLFPLGFLAIFAVVAPHSVALLFQTIVGQVVLAVVIVITYLGIRWAHRIMSIRL